MLCPFFEKIKKLKLKWQTQMTLQTAIYSGWNFCVSVQHHIRQTFMSMLQVCTTNQPNNQPTYMMSILLAALIVTRHCCTRWKKIIMRLAKRFFGEDATYYAMQSMHASLWTLQVLQGRVIEILWCRFQSKPCILHESWVLQYFKGLNTLWNALHIYTTDTMLLERFKYLAFLH